MVEGGEIARFGVFRGTGKRERESEEEEEGAGFRIVVAVMSQMG